MRAHVGGMGLFRLGEIGDCRPMALLGKTALEQFGRLQISFARARPAHHDGDQLVAVARRGSHNVKPEEQVKPVFMPSAPG